MERIADIKDFLQSLSNLPELSMRRHSVRRYLETLDDDEAAWTLGQILRITIKDENLNDALFATCGAILDCHVERLVKEQTREQLPKESYLMRLRKSALSQELKDVALWVAQAGPERQLAEGAKLPPINILPDGSQPMGRRKTDTHEKRSDEVTTGHRRALARRPDPKLLSHLLMDPDPLVLEIILQNKVLRLQDVLTIASRRPTIPQLLLKVAASPRWIIYEEVRESLVLNPYGYTQVALSLLPSLMKTTRRRVAQSGELHYFVGNFCRLINELE